MQNILFLVKTYLKDIILYFLILICVGLSVYNLYLNNTSTIDKDNEIARIELEQGIEKDTPKTSEIEFINVDLKGAVKNSGVYKVKKDSIINDVITMAGGFNSNAYKNNINLSKKVVDEMVIYVYTKTEINKLENKNKTNEIVMKEETKSTCATPNYYIYECVENGATIIETDKSNSENTSINTNETDTNKVAIEENKLININTATSNELTSLTGIGEAKAISIINYREEHGLFKNITEIMNVSGIGEALFEKIKNFITI